MNLLLGDWLVLCSREDAAFDVLDLLVQLLGQEVAFLRLESSNAGVGELFFLSTLRVRRVSLVLN